MKPPHSILIPWFFVLLIGLNMIDHEFLRALMFFMLFRYPELRNLQQVGIPVYSRILGGCVFCISEVPLYSRGWRWGRVHRTQSVPDLSLGPAQTQPRLGFFHGGVHS